MAKGSHWWQKRLFWYTKPDLRLFSHKVSPHLLRRSGSQTVMKTAITTTSIIVSLILCCTAFVPLFQSGASAAVSADDSYEMFYPEQLDNLTAPIALYPDPLLAQVLLAASFPEQIDEAARFLRAGADPKAIDDQPWDVSVKAVAHYPTVLFMMADDLDWSTALGQAYVYQSTDVMTAVQRLRAQAHSAGNLVTTPQMAVVVESGYISLWPVHPRYIYVPAYDPSVVYYRRAGYWPHPMISFGIGFAIGAWLNYDFDWYGHRIYYHGWVPRRGWVHRYRPHVHITHRYVHKRFAHIRTNRAVVHHRVNYNNLNRHRAIHRHVNYKNVRIKRSDLDHRRKHLVSQGNRQPNNRIIRRNGDASRRRLAERGYHRTGPTREALRDTETKRGALRTNRSAREPDNRLAERRNRPAFRNNRTVRDERVSTHRTEVRRERTNRSVRRSPQQLAERRNGAALRSNRTRDKARVSTERTQVRRERTNRSVRRSPQRLAERRDGAALRSNRTRDNTRVSTERTQVRRERTNRSVRRSPQREAKQRDDSALRSNRTRDNARVSTERTQVRRERMNRSVTRSPDRRMERRDSSAFRSSRTDNDRRSRGRRR